MSMELEEWYKMAAERPDDFNNSELYEPAKTLIKSVPMSEVFATNEEINIIVHWCHCYNIRNIWNVNGVLGLSRSYMDDAITYGGDCVEYVTFRHDDQDFVAFMTETQQARFEQSLRGNLQTDIPNLPDNSKPVIVGLYSDLFVSPVAYDLDTNENTSRFSSAMWYEAIQNKVITLAGLGGIGSYVAYLLGRMRPNSIFVYDNDVVEYVNLSGQLFGTQDVGQLKTTAIAEKLRQYSDYHSVFEMGLFDNDSEASDIMICGFDSMKSRKLFYRKWFEHVRNKPEEERKRCLFIDGRLAAEDLQVYCVTGNDTVAMSKYADTLFSDEEADATVCSYKQTSFMATMIASVIVNIFVNFVSNELFEAPIRELPFLIEYDAMTMHFKLDNELYKID